MWADHLTIARACEAIDEHDLAYGVAVMGCGLHLLQQDFAKGTSALTLQKQLVHNQAKASTLHVVLH